MKAAAAPSGVGVGVGVGVAASGAAASAAESLRRAGIYVKDDFLTSAQVDALRKCLRRRQANGDFAAGRIGNRAALAHRADIRGDSICWLEEPLFSPERALLERFETLRLELNREALLGLLHLELHYACYRSGAGYARHVDQPRGCHVRTLSLALYLNLDWADAGGALRLFGAQGSVHDIEPLGGRLACFLTADQEHAVLPAQRERLSISGWFSRR